MGSVSARREALVAAMRGLHRATRALFLEVPPAVLADFTLVLERAFSALEGEALESLQDARDRVQALRHSGKLENPARERVRQRAIDAALLAIGGTWERLEADVAAARAARLPEVTPSRGLAPEFRFGTEASLLEFLGGRRFRLSASSVKCAIECGADVPLQAERVVSWEIDVKGLGGGSRAGTATVATECPTCARRMHVRCGIHWAEG